MIGSNSGHVRRRCWGIKRNLFKAAFPSIQQQKLRTQKMTSVATKSTITSAASLVGCRGMGQFGSKHPKWYPCVVKMDNQDGTIKVQWDEGKKFTKSLPVEKFELSNNHEREEPVEDNVPMNIFAEAAGGDY